MWPRSSCFFPLLSLDTSSIFLPSCHFSSPHKLPFSGDSIISFRSYFRGRWGLMVWNRLGSVSWRKTEVHKGCLYCWSSLSAPRPLGLSPQNSPEPRPSGWRPEGLSSQSCAPHSQLSPTCRDPILVFNQKSAFWSLQTLSLPSFSVLIIHSPSVITQGPRQN